MTQVSPSSATTPSVTLFNASQRSSDKLKLVFAGTPDFAAASLQALIDNADSNNYEIVGVYTQPDRPSGRGQKLVASPVKQLALQHQIPVFQPVNFKQKEEIETLKSLEADLMIVAAYGIILPKVVLDTPSFGCINVHASLLPRWRGAAPIHRALIAGDKTTGITIMQMDVGLDTGDILLKSQCHITNEDTSGSLHDKLSLLGGDALVDALEKMRKGQLTPEKQDDNLANYAAKLTKQEGAIDWSLPAIELDLRIRGLSPWPGSFMDTEQGVFKIHEATLIDDDYLKTKSIPASLPEGHVLAVEKEQVIVATGAGAIAIRQIQFPGAKRLSIKDALNGKFKHAFQVGKKIGAA